MCHIVEQTQAYLCENKMVFDNKGKGIPANICTCTNASLFLEPFQLANNSQMYTSLPMPLIQEGKIDEQNATLNDFCISMVISDDFYLKSYASF